MGNTQFSSKSVAYLNPRERSAYAHRYLLWFAPETHLLVCADHLEDALELAVDYLAAHWPGILADDQVHAAYAEAIREGLSEEQAIEQAEVDTTYVDGHYLIAWEWQIVAEDPSDRWLLAWRSRR